MSTKRTAIRFAQAFNAMVKSAEIENHPLSPSDKQIIFEQLALAISDLGDNFSYSKFEDACSPGFGTEMNVAR